MTALIYANRNQARDDRQQHERLLDALDAAPSQLQRDEARLWIIAGRRGSIQTWGDGHTWLVYLIGRSARHWTAIKRRLDFMTITQDGDEEGCFRLFSLPTRHEAAIIRGAVGLRKRVDYAPDALERKRASMARALSARESARTPRPGIAMPEEVAGDLSRQGVPVVERERILETEEALP